jgi:hypothetical protein
MWEHGEEDGAADGNEANQISCKANPEIGHEKIKVVNHLNGNLDMYKVDWEVEPLKVE